MSRFQISFHTAAVLSATLLLASGIFLYVWLDAATHSLFYPLNVTAMFAAFFVLPALVLLWHAPWRVKFALVSTFLLAILLVRNFEWNTRKEFLRDLAFVESGMTRMQVKNIMHAYFENQTSDANTLAFRHTNEGWGNADIGLVTFANGRVVHVEFWGD